MIDDDTSFVLKNLALYNAEQCRRLTGNVIEIDESHFTKANDISIPPIDNNKTKNSAEIDSDLDQFFHHSDLTPMTAESQSLLDEMFSS